MFMVGRKLHFAEHHRVLQLTDTLNLNYYFITGDDWPYPGGRAGQDQIAGFERHDLRDMSDQVGNLEHQLRGTPGLPGLSINSAGYCEVGAVQIGVDPGAERTERVKTLS